MLVVGLTGSIGTGKTTIAEFLRNKKIPVISSDNIVDKLYQYDAVEIIRKIFPETIHNNRVDKPSLLNKFKESPENLEIIENIIHPMVRSCEQKFLSEMFNRGEKIVFFETPLIFEKNKEHFFDLIVVVTCSFETKLNRVLSRKKYTEENFLFLLSKQMDEKEKIDRADYVINTECKIEGIEKKINKMLNNFYKIIDENKKCAR
ncbi:dephospho-CoA kinase [Candidatus Liberibacter americanus]|uniref:Dephospho-CoA kinase n=1 Tax=Candidatus Liberibacter americanus str. Sao Paulo TaxID=1261131 RepID=U6B3K3_9HYPH|nr:dephospho-CoA kinase [Candidatus Liberibacter americanus]AHA27515.1 Dephospho-CoA kinase [Candidatus Liberibacter americanus str. Sao Paulo]EMS36523.1 dephospho-CoA kinase [Candidatus Liberibacter americanus PW_SP]